MNRRALMLALPFLLIATVVCADPPPSSRPGPSPTEPLFSNDPKSPGLLPPPSLLPGAPTASPDFENALKTLREERAAFDKLRRKIAADRPGPDLDNTTNIKLRLQIAELLQRLREKQSRKVEVPEARGDIPPAVPRPDPLKPTPTPAADRLTLAQLLFRSQNYAAALNALNNIDRADLPSADRTWADYLKASCLRHQGKLSEALVLYREVANSKQDTYLSETAAWQVNFIRWRQDMEGKLKALSK